jgi:exodeoxyribonuclease V gamma subunit
VGQLLDVLDASFSPAPGGRSVREQVTTIHPLQAFSPASFDAADPASYDARMLEAARRLIAPRVAPPPFLAGPLPGPDDAEVSGSAGIVDLTELVRFWQGPVQGLLSQRLGIRRRDEKVAVLDREPVEVDHLTAWKLAQALLDHRLGGRRGDWAAAARRRGLVPTGAPGEYVLADAAGRVEHILSRSAGARRAPRGEVPIDLRLHDVRILGTVTGVYGRCLVRLQAGDIKPKQLLAQWIEFLALNAQRPDQPWEARIFGRDRAPHFSVVPQPRGAQARLQLQHLVDGYRQGQLELLRFFPAASYAYAEARRGGDSEESARFKAGDDWHGPRERPGEGDDALLALVFGPDSRWREVADESFARLALEIWSPILAAEAPP